MSKEFELEINFPANVKLRGKDDNYSAILTRKIDNRTFPVAALKNLTAAECYTRLGVMVPKNEIEPATGLAHAKRTLSDALTAISGRDIVLTTEMSDILLDAINDLGHVMEELEDETQTKTE